MALSGLVTSFTSWSRCLFLTIFLICLLGRHGNCVSEPTTGPGHTDIMGPSVETLITGKIATAAEAETVKQTVQPQRATATEPRDETVVTSVAKAETKAATYPNLLQDAAACGRTGLEKSWICDAEGVLPATQADKIDEILEGLNANASCICNCSNNSSNATLDASEGYVLAVAVVRSIQGGDSSSSNRTYELEQFSDSVRQDWFTERSCDDSALILAHFMYNCSKIHISLGDDLSDLLPEGTLSSIYEAALPSLEKGDLSPALVLTVRRLAAALEEASQAQPPPDNLVWGILGVITISSILLFHYWIKY